MNQPEVGPYRILRRLGSGGMGEVYLAEDSRLGRLVAIKRLRPDAEDTPHRRERLWREAKAAAGISHPSVVQIFDVLTEPSTEGGKTDYIVMEYVEGLTLRQQLEARQLSFEQILDIARHIASGLAAAHAKGVVHRDLKSENILLTAEGHPKIADFGIAKRTLPGGEVEESLTAHRQVIGTCRAMAPEQARGGAVDHRTDLFSFGVLLYEAFTGTSPFEAENAYTTLSQVLVHQPPAPHEISPALPDELSYLIEHLLQKEPDLRPRSAREVLQTLREISAAHGREMLPTPPEGYPTLTLTGSSSPHLQPTAEMLQPRPTAPTIIAQARRGQWRRFVPWVAGAAVALAAVAIFLTQRPPAQPLVVAVAEPMTQDGDQLPEDEAETIHDAVRFAALRSLVSLEGVAVKPPAEVDAASGRGFAALAAEVGAQAILSTEVGCRNQVCRVSLNRVAADGNLEWAASFEAPREDLRLLASAVETYTRQAFADHRPRSGSTGQVADGEQLRDFLELRRRARAETEAPERLLEQLEELRRRSDPFPEIDLLGADLARRAFVASRDAAYLTRARALLREAREKAPEDPRWAVNGFTLALTAGDLEGAELALSELARLAPGDTDVAIRRAMLLEAQGKSDEAVRDMRTAIQNRPSVAALSNLAAMEYRQGDIEGARRSLQRLLERAPDSVAGRSQLALLELVDGDPARAAELYGRLAAESDGLAELSNLGLARLLGKQYADAAIAFRQVYEREPRNPQLVLNYADALTLQGDGGAAEPLYRKVVELSEGDVGSGSALVLTVRAQALAHLGNRRQAVAAVQRALQLAPENSQVAYEAAVVYALVGDTASAVVSAERALELGYGARWFAFPWFDEVRRDSELARDLAAGAPSP